MATEPLRVQTLHAVSDEPCAEALPSQPAAAGDGPRAGTRRTFDGQERAFYEGYWIKAYPVPEDTLQAKRRLIEAMTRRLFNHTEHGLNIPGHRLAEAREQYERETDPARKRVKGAMYAGAMFNRATDIFTRLVDLQALGVEISSKNDLMRECGQCLQDALSLCRLVRHRSGEEGIDELWGEPFRAFCIPLAAFHESRYLKMAQAMRDVDRIAAVLGATFRPPLYPGFAPVVDELARAARAKIETLATDAEIFDIQADLVTACERLTAFRPEPGDVHDDAQVRHAVRSAELICSGRDLALHIARARVSMPKSTQEFVERCERHAVAGSPLELQLRREG
jgi:hypothetical protein